MWGKALLLWTRMALRRLFRISAQTGSVVNVERV
jgi:hypothetical protein